MLQGLTHYVHKASAGERLRNRWGLGSELSIAPRHAVPKFGKRFLERNNSIARSLVTEKHRILLRFFHRHFHL